MKVAELAIDEFARRMASRGVALRIPPVTVRLRSPLRQLAEQVTDLYRDYELADAEAGVDFDIRVLRCRNRWQRRTQEVQFVVDGTAPFEPFPVPHAFAMFEWGLNWVFAQRMHQFLLLHAAVVERGGYALVMPAWPGSGKSTLAASLACRGWRYLSDEFGAIADGGTEAVPFVRPTGLKNASIDIIRAFAADACIGPVFSGTHKGTVAHFRAPAESVRQGDRRARIAAVVFPEFRAEAQLTVESLSPAAAFLRLAGNAFNYEIVGERGFRTVAAIVRRCQTLMLRYGDLGEAHAALDVIMRNADDC
jgi:HprK-related kinase A